MDHTLEHIYKLLSEIPDPEIPVISIVELGVIRDVSLNNESILLSFASVISTV
mgnify:CR=1 FL=1